MKPPFITRCLLILGFFVIVILASFRVQHDYLSARIAHGVDQSIEDFGENLNIGILVEDLKTHQILYEKNADRYFAPASNQKLFTAFAALNFLGPNYTYETQLFADPKQLTHPIIFEKTKSSAQLLVSLNSPPLGELITAMLKESDNLIANTVFKTMGALYFHETGTWKNGLAAVLEVLKTTTPIDTQQISFIDGAGGSSYNYLTPQQIISLLNSIYASAFSSQFMASLPISGINGTLKDRMSDPVMKGKVWAKTGTISGVTALSGFLETEDHRLLAFSIMINGFIDPPAKYKALEDKICEAMVKT